MGKGFRCTLSSDNGIKGAKERLPRKKEEREGRRKKEEEREGRRKKEEEREYSIEDFLPTANNYDTHFIILIDKIPQTYQ